jgi:hypothetical protein
VSTGVWPNFFVVGAARCGTTSLWAYFKQHPDIFMSEVKEPSFFSQYEIGRYYVHDQSAYLRLFSRGARKKYRGEASPSYLWHEGTPAKIRRVSPEAKIVISLRDPVARAYSSYWLFTHFGQERRPFLDAIQDEIAEPPAPGEPPPFYTGRGFYADSVARYLETFGDNARVLVFEELVADVRGHLREVFSFLEIDASVTDRIRTEGFNSSAKPRNTLASKILRSQAMRRIAGTLIPLEYRPKVGKTLLSPRSATPKMEPEAKHILSELYAEDVARVETLLGRSLPWPMVKTLSSSRETTPGR